MRLRCGRLMWPAALVAACAPQAAPPQTRAQEPQPPLAAPPAAAPDLRTPLYEADHRPAAVIRMAPRVRTEQNPYGLQRDWLRPDKAEAWLRGELARSDRAILHLPMGSGRGSMSSSQWETGEPWRRELLVRVLNEWLAAEPGRTVSIYIGCRVGDPAVHDMTAAVPPDPDDPVVLDRFLATVKPWITRTKIHRVWLDNGSNPANREAVVKLARWCRKNLDLTIGMEALPRVEDGTLDWEIMRETPVMAFWRYYHNADRAMQWVIPPAFEALVVLQDRDNARRAVSPELVKSFRQRGFTLASVGEHDTLAAEEAGAR